jgi:Protein of unknown function (DUF2934)
MAKSPRTTPASSTPKPSAPKAAAARKSKPVEGAGASANGTEEDAIAQRAYEIYQERGGMHGADIEDWLPAERDVRARRSGRR